MGGTDTIARQYRHTAVPALRPCVAKPALKPGNTAGKPVTFAHNVVTLIGQHVNAGSEAMLPGGHQRVAVNNASGVVLSALAIFNSVRTDGVLPVSIDATVVALIPAVVARTF